MPAQAVVPVVQIRSVAESRAPHRLEHRAHGTPDNATNASLRTIPAEDRQAITAAVDDALPSVMPLLQACYDRARPELARADFTSEVDLTLIGDPDIGTRIDADVLLDPRNRLPRAFVDCLRSELQLLELPPLADGEHVTLTYPFAFPPVPNG